jgi:hypothetical protein
MPESAHAEGGEAPALEQSEPAPTDDDSPVKKALESIKHAEAMQARLQQQYAPSPRPMTLEQQIDADPSLSPHKKAFLKANPHVLQNLPAAGYYHRQGTAQGIADDTEEMNQFVLSGMRREREAIENARRAPYRDPPPVNTPEPPKRSMPHTAPVTRDAPSMSAGAVPTRITLSPEEIMIARNSYTAPDMSNEQKERAYAMAKLRMLQMRKDGRLNE